MPGGHLVQWTPDEAGGFGVASRGQASSRSLPLSPLALPRLSQSAMDLAFVAPTNAARDVRSFTSLSKSQAPAFVNGYTEDSNVPGASCAFDAFVLVLVIFCFHVPFSLLRKAKGIGRLLRCSML